MALKKFFIKNFFSWCDQTAIFFNFFSAKRHWNGIVSCTKFPIDHKFYWLHEDLNCEPVTCNATTKPTESSAWSYCSLTLSWRRSLSYRNQFIDLTSKSMDWFLFGRVLHHGRVEPWVMSLMALVYVLYERVSIFLWWLEFVILSKFRGSIIQNF